MPPLVYMMYFLLQLRCVCFDFPSAWKCMFQLAAIQVPKNLMISTIQHATLYPYAISPVLDTNHQYWTHLTWDMDRLDSSGMRCSAYCTNPAQTHPVQKVCVGLIQCRMWPVLDLSSTGCGQYCTHPAQDVASIGLVQHRMWPVLNPSST